MENGRGIDLNLDAAAAIGEIIGAAAVVISVVYLAIQIRKQTEESRLAATRDLAFHSQENFQQLVQDPELLEVYRLGIADYDSLPENERLRLSIFFANVFRVAELQYLHGTRNRTDPIHSESMGRGLSEGLTFPGMRRWWELSRDMFDDEFQDEVERAITRARTRGYRGSFGTISSNRG